MTRRQLFFTSKPKIWTAGSWVCACCSHQGPCRRKLDGIIQGMKDTSRVMALSLYLPNCDRKGFFKRKQVSQTDFYKCSARLCVIASNPRGFTGVRIFLLFFFSLPRLMTMFSSVSKKPKHLAGKHLNWQGEQQKWCIYTRVFDTSEDGYEFNSIN